ncbi:MAG: hypothetical protein ACTSRG_10460 [Candidatus Helarchaeota archaeon]
MLLRWDEIFHEIAVGFKITEAAFILLFALIFFIRIRNEEETKNQKEIYLGTAVFLICYVFSDIFFLLAYYGQMFYVLSFYYENWKIATIFGISGTTFFIFMIEKNIDIIKRLNTKFAFTIISSGVLVVAILINVEISRIIAYLSLPFVFLIVLLFHFYIYLKAPKEYKKALFLSFIGFFIFLASYTLPTEIARNILSLPIEDLLVISSTCVIFGVGLYTFTVPPNAELEWHQKIIKLIIIHSQKGLSLFDYSFRGVSEGSDLIAGGLVGISSIIQEMTSSETKVKIIKQEQANILLEHGSFVTIALISVEDLQILRKKLNQLIDLFESLFRDILDDWRGDVGIFQPAKALIEEVFEVSKFFPSD